MSELGFNTGDNLPEQFSSEKVIRRAEELTGLHNRLEADVTMTAITWRRLLYRPLEEADLSQLMANNSSYETNYLACLRLTLQSTKVLRGQFSSEHTILPKIVSLAAWREQELNRALKPRGLVRAMAGPGLWFGRRQLPLTSFMTDTIEYGCSLEEDWGTCSRLVEMEQAETDEKPDRNELLVKTADALLTRHFAAEFDVFQRVNENRIR